jgi:hypothetical protein
MARIGGGVNLAWIDYTFRVAGTAYRLEHDGSHRDRRRSQAAPAPR